MDFCYITISGGYFISQLSILIKLYKARSKFLDNHNFDVIFSASGGNIAAYLSLLFNKNETSIERKLNQINHTLFINLWSRGIIKMNFLNLFQNSIYREGVGLKDFLISNYENFNNSKLPEIWSLSYNNDVNCGSLFCSKSYEHSFFKKEITSDMIKMGIGEIKYMNSDLDLISKICIASAAIPGVVTPIEIDNSIYIDGGVLNATPGSYFSNNFNSNLMHYYYIMPCNLYDINIRHHFINKKKNTHWSGIMLNSIKSLTVSQILNDRNSIFEKWKNKVNAKEVDLTNEIYYDISDNKLENLLKELNNDHFFMVCYTDVCSVDISKFNSDDLKTKLKKGLNSLCIEVYFIKK